MTRQILRARDKNAQIGRQDGQKIDDAEEAGGVSQWSSDTQQTQEVFDGEQYGKDPFTGIQLSAVNSTNTADTVQHHQHHADDNRDDQQYIEQFAGRRVGLKNNLVQRMPPSAGFFISHLT